jgi:hypothetical protein
MNDLFSVEFTPLLKDLSRGELFDRLNALGKAFWNLQSLADLLLWSNSRDVNE